MKMKRATIEVTRRISLLNIFGIVLLMGLIAGCKNPESARRKAGEELQEKMQAIDKQYADGLITSEQKAQLESQAIETHKIRWNKIGNVQQYGPAMQPRAGGSGYRNYN